MKKLALLALSTALLSGTAFAAGEPMVGGAAMYPSKTIVQNASQAKNLTTLVSAVKQAGLVDTLSGPGPFTVFAPTNAAFNELPKSTVDGLMKPDEKDKLKQILTYHVVAGKLDTAQLRDDVKKNDGKFELKTVEGDNLTVTDHDGKLMLTDAKGGTAEITTANVNQSNGIVQVINHVLMPNS
jgi:uncharacterized surface protein with fasciclin (FAS1) repeats